MERTHAAVSFAGTERMYDLGGRDELSIGRRDCDVSIPQGSVSPKHARLVRKDGVWHVEDLGSTNGTFVANAKITPHEPVALTAQSIVRVGDALVRVHLGVDEAPAPSREPQARVKPRSYGPFIPLIVVALVAVVGAAYSCTAKHESHDGHGQEHKR